MTEKYKFHVALSFSEESSIVAEDIYNFLTECGLKTYYYKKYPDLTKGYLDDKIISIYENSCINCMIWSNEYANKTMDAIVTTESQTMYNRHIKKNETETLFILKNDINIKEDLKIADKFSGVTFHSLKTIGLFGCRNYIIERLIDTFNYFDNKENVKIYHPEQESFNRGSISLCKFKIDPEYESDDRWKKRANIRVKVIHHDKPFDSDLKVFLIPSGRVTPLLSHSKILESQPISKNLKEKFSRKFIKDNMDKEMTGYLFFIMYNDLEYPFLYSLKYDDYLNKMLCERE